MKVKFNEPLSNHEILGLIVQQQDNFKQRHLHWELVDIGVFDFIFLDLPSKMDKTLTNFFGAALTRTYHDDYKIQAFLI